MPEASKTPSAASAAIDAVKEPVIELARGTVAKGRTVLAQTSERRIVNYTPAGDPIYRYTERAHKPGEEIELPKHEIDHLRSAGFLVDPNAPVLQSDVGPNFSRKA